MPISRKDVQHVAALARIAMSETEQERFTKELGKILAFVSQLEEVDTADVPETAQVTGLRNVTRKDSVKPGIDREAFLKNAPAREADELKVRGIFS